MDHAEHEDHLILVDDVIHHPVVANAKPMKRISESLNCLDRLTADPTWLRSVFGEFLQGFDDPTANLR